MAYKYNEKTGEFEDIPQATQKPKTRAQSAPNISIPSINSTGQRSQPVSRTYPSTTSQSSSSSSNRHSSSSNFLEGLGGVIVGLLPYIIGILLAVTCN